MIQEYSEVAGNPKLKDKLLSEFNDVENSSSPECEEKTIVDGIYKLEDFAPLIQEIKSKLNASTIFDGVLTDTRFYDTENKDKSELYEDGIYLLRIRKEHKNNKGVNDKYIFTLKESNGLHAIEYEKEINKGFAKEILIDKYGLIEIEQERKKRIELEFYISINKKNEKIKVAFDKYQQNNSSKNDYSKLPAYFEVEAENEDALEVGLEKILDLDFFKNKNYYHTYRGKKVMLEQQENNYIKNIYLSSGQKLNGLIDEIKNFIKFLIDENNPYFSKNTNSINNFEFNQENLYFQLYDIIRNNIINIGAENNSISSYFSRMMDNPIYKEQNKDKKFDDKFEREFSGYIRALSSAILSEIKNSQSDNNKLNNKIINLIILRKLDSLLKLLFIFNDSLTKPELEKILKLEKNTIDNYYSKFKNNIEKIYSNKNSIPKIWDNNYIDLDGKKVDNEDYNSRILDRLSTSYSRAFAASAYKGDFGNFEIIQEKQEEIEIQQFEFIAKQFSHWLNSGTRDTTMLDNIKKLFLEDSYHVFLLSKEGLAFNNFSVDNNSNFNQEFINKIFEHFGSNLFNKNNFILDNKGPELFAKFINNIFSNIDKLKEDIINDLREFNVASNKKYIKNFSGSNLSNLKKNINFKNWKQSNFDDRLYIFFNNIFEINDEGIKVRNNYLYAKGNNQDEVLKKLVEFEFLKTHKSISGEFENEFNNYFNEVQSQFNFLEKCFEGVDKLKNNEDKINYLLLNYANEVQLLVSYFQFNLKIIENKIDYNRKPSKNKLILNTDFEKKDVLTKYTLYSQTFIERLVTRFYYIEQFSNNNNYFNKNKNNFEFITSCSSGYNSSIYTKERMIELHDRIGNDKPIDLNKNFNYKIGGKKIFFKDIIALYLPSEDENDFQKIMKFFELGLEIERNLLNGDKVSDNNLFFKRLEEIGFPIKNYVAMKKLLEFHKFSYKMILPYLNDLQKEAFNTTGKYIESLHMQLENYNYLQNHRVVAPKKLNSLIRKGFSKHGGNIEKINDSSRTMIFGNTIQDLENTMFNFINLQSLNKNVQSLRLEDKIGNIFKKAIRQNGYRDASIVLTTYGGETIEIQFQLLPYYEIKTGNLIIKENNGKKLLNLLKDENLGFQIKDFDIGKQVQKKIIDTDIDNDIGEFLNSKQKQDFINYCRISGQKIPKSFAILANINEDDIIDKSLRFNPDFTYNIERTFGKNNEEVNRKLMLLDKILFDIANGYLMQQERERVRKLKEKPNKKNTKRKKNRKKG